MLCPQVGGSYLFGMFWFCPCDHLQLIPVPENLVIRGPDYFTWDVLIKRGVAYPKTRPEWKVFT